MTKQCVLIQHGLSFVNNKIGVCCYNMLTDVTNRPSSYNIDPIGCSACIDQENNNIFSYRQGANQKYGFNHLPDTILVIDVTPNKNCNLTCKICNEYFSSSWAKLKNIPIVKEYNQSIKDFEKNLKKYNLVNLQEINFSGGEPFLNNNIQRYIDRLESYVDFSKITLRFSTNGTIKLTDKLIAFFQKFKLVTARFSLDDIQEGHEYQRVPSIWSEWERNWIYFLENMPHNVIPSINRTVSMLNINRLHLLEQWKNNYLTTRYTDTIELIDHFAFGKYALQSSLQIKEYILNTFGNKSNSWKYIQNRSNSTNYSELIKSISEHDRLHNTSFKEFNRDLYNLIFA